MGPDRLVAAGAVPTAAVAADFDAFYADAWAPMVRVATLLVGPGGAAEELVQDAFVRVLGCWGRLDNPGAYLRVAVVNACRSWRRRRAVAARRPVGPRAEAGTTDEVDDLHDALAVLSARQRAAVVLRYYEDLPEAEIARVLGCRPGTVKSTLNRALARLGEVLEP